MRAEELIEKLETLDPQTNVGVGVFGGATAIDVHGVELRTADGMPVLVICQKRASVFGLDDLPARPRLRSHG